MITDLLRLRLLHRIITETGTDRLLRLCVIQALDGDQAQADIMEDPAQDGDQLPDLEDQDQLQDQDREDHDPEDLDQDHDPDQDQEAPDLEDQDVNCVKR